MSNVVVIVGNGFNYMIKNFIQAEYDHNKSIHDQFSVSDINTLCEHMEKIINL